MCFTSCYDTVEKFADMVEERLMKEIDADAAEEEKVSHVCFLDMADGSTD